MIYNYKFISNLKQLDQEKMELLDGLLKTQASQCTKAFEIGTYAGYVTLLLGGHIGNITTIDYDQFVSPNVDEHKKLNSMHFIESYTGPSLLEVFDKHFTNDYDLVYMHRDISSQIIINKIKKIQTTDVLFICYEDDKFTVNRLKAPKRTATKVSTEEKVTPTKRQKTTKTPKQPKSATEATV